MLEGWKVGGLDARKLWKVGRFEGLNIGMFESLKVGGL